MAGIVFELLAPGGTPDTTGDGLGFLLGLCGYGTNAAGDYGVGFLPTLTGSGTGFGLITGTGLGSFGPLTGYATNAVPPILTTYSGWAFAYLPAMYGVGFDGGTLIPSSGNALANLSGLTSVSTGVLHDRGSGLGILPALTGYGFEAAGNYGVGVLPQMIGYGLQVLPTITDYFTLQQSPGYTQIYASPAFHVTQPDALDFTTATMTDVVSVFNETLQFGVTPLALASLRVSLSDNLSLADPLRQEHIGVITDTLDLASTQIGDIVRIAAVIDTLVLTGACTATVSALSEIVEILTLRDVARSVQDGTITDALALVEALEARGAYYEALVANAAFADVLLGLAVVTVLVGDSLSLSTTLTPVASLLAAIRDELEFSVSFNLGDTPYVAYSMNAVTKSLSRYSNFKFDSLASFNGEVYGSGAAGLYKLQGTTDAGAAIPWRIRTGLTNFGSGRNKGLDAAYIGYTATGRVVLKCIVVAPGSGDKIAHWYELTTPVAGAAHPGRILTGRGLRSVYWAFELTNVDAGAIALDTIELHPVVFEGRLP